MDNRELILSSTQWIEHHIKDSMTVVDVAHEAGFSQYYFSRLFKGVMGIPPKSYINHRKVTASLDMLMDRDKRVLDVAVAYGFASSEVYNRAFSKYLGMSPSEARETGRVEKNRLLMPQSKVGTTFVFNQPYREPEVVRLPELKLVGIPFYWDIETKNDLTKQWMMLLDVKDTIRNLLQPERSYQLQFWFPDQDEEMIYFYVALEVRDFDEVPFQLSTKTIPSQTYLKFWHKGFSNRVGDTYDYIYSEWLPKTQYKLPHHYNFEYYGQEYMGPHNPESISEIFIPIVAE